ncbi:unnamed protein product, partial [Bubo scandiacus]
TIYSPTAVEQPQEPAGGDGEGGENCAGGCSLRRGAPGGRPRRAAGVYAAGAPRARGCEGRAGAPRRPCRSAKGCRG